ncbi:MAG: ABC transporter ATP-binding protein [Bacteriovoracales bacterium]|nr:ABC transporter ATP-binding protein [Bacteriovoracales bacterium]
MKKAQKLLEVQDLCVSFPTRKGTIHPVRHLSFEMKEGEILGVVGESGCGKSLANLALMGLLPDNADLKARTLRFRGRDLLSLSNTERRKLRGKEMAMIFQDPMAALNPCLTIGRQIDEAIAVHLGGSKKERRERALELLDQMGLPAPAKRLGSYPHELSGGMCQRVMIAQAIASRPGLLIADEPTTALDATIQSQILDLLLRLREERKMGILFVSHDIGVVANISDRAQVMYAGEVVESGVTDEIIKLPIHPYTEALFKSLPGHQKQRQSTLYNLPGVVPNLLSRPTGCQFHPRCPHAGSLCEERDPERVEVLGLSYKCHLPLGEWT